MRLGKTMLNLKGKAPKNTAMIPYEEYENL